MLFKVAFQEFEVLFREFRVLVKDVSLKKALFV